MIGMSQEKLLECLDCRSNWQTWHVVMASLGSQLKQRLLEHFYELNLTEYLSKKVDRWKKNIEEEANEKRLLRIKAILVELKKAETRLRNQELLNRGKVKE